MFRVLVLVALLVVPVCVFASPVYFPGNGHTYELVPVQTTWAGAQAAAAAASYAGYPGHLVTITSAAENNFLSATFASGQAQYFSWIGGYEPNDDGVWLWGGGPENGVQFAYYNTATAPYFYTNWSGVEPNDYAPGEDFAAMNLGATFASVGPGEWIDSPNPNPSDPIKAYIIEYETTLAGVGDSPDGALLVHSTTPNPFSSTTRIEYSHAGTDPVRIDIFDATGRMVRRLKNGMESAGDHVAEWDGRTDSGKRVGAGVYFYVVRSGTARSSGKLFLIR